MLCTSVVLKFKMCLFCSHVGDRVGKPSSGRVSLGVHTEDSGDRQQHQEAEGGDYKGTDVFFYCQTQGSKHICP